MLFAAIAIAAHAQPVLFHEHGHGLAFASDGKTLLAPSRAGLATYRDGEWTETALQPVPSAISGFSGFAVTQSATYSSGRSKAGVAASRPVGLLKSEDGGNTWRALALAGESDFRLLAAGYQTNTIYVLNVRANSVMPAPGLYLTRDEGRTWRRATLRGLNGEIHGIAAHPSDARTIAVATDRGLHLSRDGGDSFVLLDRREPVTAVAFDLRGERLRYAHTLSSDIAEIDLKPGKRRVLRLPPLKMDYVTCLAQSPVDERVLAFATRRKAVYLSPDGGVSWRRICAEADG